MRLLFIILLLAASLFAAVGDNAYDIVKKSQDLIRGVTSHITLTMKIVNPDYTRTMQMESWASGNDKSFILVLKPAKEEGNTFLKIGNDIWQYIRSVDEEIKIMPTMMYQGMMGSEFTYDDMVREDSFADDYASTVHEEGENYWVIMMLPKPGTGITYSYLYYAVHKESYLPIYVAYYDKRGEIRQLDYSEPKTYSSHEIPTLWTMTNKRKDGRVTTVTVDAAEFDVKLDPSIFEKANLRRGSR
jgi:outer membrane lipoprotein-sorting protein